MTTECTCEGTEAVTFCKDCGIGMTTDHDLLKDITDKHEYHIGGHTQVVLVNGCITCKVYYALRAVVELHKPDGIKYLRGFIGCTESASGAWVQYPCPTIQAIEGELR